MSTHDRDIFGHEWSPCPHCPHRTPGSCPSRANRRYCVLTAPEHPKSGDWCVRVASKPPEDREGPELPPPEDRGVGYSPTPRDNRLRVGFLGVALTSHGGTETWHETLIPRLDKEQIQVVGYGITAPHLADPGAVRRMRQHCQVPIGFEGCQALARDCDVLVYWGVDQLGAYVGRGGPTTIGVSHGDGNSPWAHSVFRDSDAHTDHYVAVSEAARGPVPEARRAQAKVIYNSVDPSRLVANKSREEIRRELGVPLDAPMVLYFGRFSAEKRPELAARVIGDVPGAWLVLCGDGRDREMVVREAEPHKDRVIFAGVRHDPGDVMNAADVLLNPSECEGFGLTVAEALWVGLPVVGTGVGLLADHPGLAARVLPRLTTFSAWSDAITQVLSGALPGSVGRAREWVRARLTPEHFAAQWSEFLLEVGRPPVLVPVLERVPVPAPPASPPAVRVRSGCCGEAPGPQRVSR